MDKYGIKIISWRLGGRHTQPLATMPFISGHVSLQQQSGCAIDLESLGIRQRQKRLFNLDASDNLYEMGVFFSVFIGCTEFGIWFKQEVEMDIIWNQDNFMEARRSPHTATSHNAIYISRPMSACSNSPVAPLIWRAWESDRDRKGCNGCKCMSNSKQASKPFLPSGTEDEDRTTSKYWLWRFNLAPW